MEDLPKNNIDVLRERVQRIIDRYGMIRGVRALIAREADIDSSTLARFLKGAGLHRETAARMSIAIDRIHEDFTTVRGRKQREPTGQEKLVREKPEAYDPLLDIGARMKSLGDFLMNSSWTRAERLDEMERAVKAMHETLSSIREANERFEKDGSV